MELFSGVGGWSLGAWLAGWRFDSHFFSEVDPYASAVFQKRFPDSVPLGDIRKIRGGDLPDGEWYFAGGFPCQDISVAGRGAGIGVGTRSGLWFEFARLIRELRPRFALVENVGALASKGLHIVLGDLFEAGYDAEWFDIRASDVGAPHRRERLWIVAYPIGIRFDGRSAAIGNEGEVSGQQGEETLGAPCTVMSPGSGGGREALAHSVGSGQQAGISGAVGAEEYLGSYNIIRSGFGCAWTPESRVPPVADGVPHRVDRLRCSGNALVPQIAQIIWEAVKEMDSWGGI
jgi:DNA (cytosine-5)-methyltransferase 1